MHSSSYVEMGSWVGSSVQIQAARQMAVWGGAGLECWYGDLRKYKTGILSARKCNLVTCCSRLPNDTCLCTFGGGRGVGVNWKYRWDDPGYLVSTVLIQSDRRGARNGLECLVPKSKVCLRNFVGPFNFCGHIIFMNITVYKRGRISL